MSPILLRGVCGKGRHTLVSVTADPSGKLWVSYAQAFLATVEPRRYERRDTSHPFTEPLEGALYCTSCRNRFVTTTPILTEALERGLKTIVVTPLDYMEHTPKKNKPHVPRKKAQR